MVGPIVLGIFGEIRRQVISFAFSRTPKVADAFSVCRPEQSHQKTFLLGLLLQWAALALLVCEIP